MKIAVFGGSFDPPHLGHAMACLWILETGHADHVLLIPAARHAFGKQFAATFEQRLAMCRLATERLAPHVTVSAIEGERDGVSYMVDTLRTLVARHPADEFRLVVGTDIVADVPRWREGAEVLRLAPLIELPRPHGDARFADRPGALPPISSTDVRQALLTGQPTDLLLARNVREYISANKLYQTERSQNP